MLSISFLDITTMTMYKHLRLAARHRRCRSSGLRFWINNHPVSPPLITGPDNSMNCTFDYVSSCFFFSPVCTVLRRGYVNETSSLRISAASSKSVRYSRGREHFTQICQMFSSAIVYVLNFHLTDLSFFRAVFYIFPVRRNTCFLGHNRQKHMPSTSFLPTVQSSNRSLFTVHSLDLTDSFPWRQILNQDFQRQTLSSLLLFIKFVLSGIEPCSFKFSDAFILLYVLGWSDLKATFWIIFGSGLSRHLECSKCEVLRVRTIRSQLVDILQFPGWLL